MDFPFCVIADGQSEGRGTKGRPFYSPEGKGIYLSACIPRIPRNLGTVTPQAAAAVVEAIRNVTGLNTQIKWVNDILFRGKKIAGILAESMIHKSSAAVIIGIGINLYPSAMPDEIRNTAGTLWADPADAKKEALFKEILAQIEKRVKDDDVGYLPIYRNHSAVLGKKIEISEGCTWISAKALDIDTEGRLVVRVENTLRTLYTEEIRLIH